MLPKLIPESELNYLRESGVYAEGDGLRGFTIWAVKEGLTAEQVNRSIHDGIEWYLAKKESTQINL